MTSQYDIEIGIGNIQRMNFDLKELKKIVKPSKIQKKQIKAKEEAMHKLNVKLTNWCNVFDKTIKPLDSIAECDKPDKIFVVRIPKNVEAKVEKEYVDQYHDFIKEKNYKVNGMDKQTGYLTNIYSFFCTEIKK